MTSGDKQKKYNIHSTIQQISEWYNAQSQVFCAKSSDVGKRQLHYDEAEIISEHIKGTTVENRNVR